MTKVALYARVSSGPQELSLDAQIHELRQHAALEGFEVVEEVRDRAEKRHMIDRPGLDQVRNLAAPGAIEEVWAVEFGRFGEDAYLPHSPAELEALAAEGLLSGEVLAGLDPGRPYGIAYYGRTRSAYESMHSKRRKVKRAPRSEWTAIPVCLEGAGLDRGQIEQARALIANNRAPSKVGDHEYHLSWGFLFCADCGRAMISRARRFPTRTHRYSRCDGERKTRGTAPPCPNRRSHEAHGLEHLAASTFETHASRDGLLRLYDEAVARGGRIDPARAEISNAAPPSPRSCPTSDSRGGTTCARTPAACSPARTWTPCSPTWTNSGRPSKRRSGPPRTGRRRRSGCGRPATRWRPTTRCTARGPRTRTPSCRGST